jgi:L-amino acid N-acyltransferase YncA
MTEDLIDEPIWESDDCEDDIVLMNGRIAHVRAARPSDLGLIMALHDRASQDNIYRRFFGVSRESSHQFAQIVCAPHSRVHALVATLDGRVVGLATAEPIAPQEAEVSLFIDDRLHHLGVGSLLLDQLARWQRAHGIHTMVADVLASNGSMLRVFHHSGLTVRTHSDSTVVTLRVGTQPDTHACEYSGPLAHHTTAGSDETETKTKERAR